MKRFILFLLVIVIGQRTTFAYDFSAVAPSGQTLYYNIDGGNVQVTYPGSYNSGYYYGHAKPTGSLTIPSSVTYGGQTYVVTSIGNHTFHDCYQLTSVSIPNTVISIEEGAFLKLILLLIIIELKRR